MGFLTLQWVVDTGIPIAEAPNTVRALINSMQNPRHGVIVVISSPIATISLAPHVQRPAVIPKPPNNKRYHGVVGGSPLPNIGEGNKETGKSMPPCQ